MEWTLLLLLAGLWLFSPVILLIALIIARRQIRLLRAQLLEQVNNPSAGIADPEPSGAMAQTDSLRYAPVARRTAPGPMSGAQQTKAPPELTSAIPFSATNSPLADSGEAVSPIAATIVAVTQPLNDSVVNTGTSGSDSSGAATVIAGAQPVHVFVADTLTTESDESDWRPAAPNPLESVLETVSGWPKLIAPFLAQNIGWFIGGFCFIAGALFLIANTAGFVNALVVFASLFSVNAFLLWAGYQFRRQRPELVITSGMLLTLGMLLAPLVLAVAMRLLIAASDTGWLIVGVFLIAFTVMAFGWAASLSSALIDRVLQGRYARLLTMLGAVQLAAPLAALAPDWRVLLGLHTLVLGLLGYGLRVFTRVWLQRLFVDQRLTTYYAAGMLVYTAAVSFIHLTWLWPTSLPVGYAGPLLMALCILLLPVDAAFKEWVSQYVFLSRFTFFLYGLSGVALTVAFQSMPTLLLTLVLGGGLYGWMAWRYYTLPPLYLGFGCIVGLYGFSLLYWLPPAWHGLVSQPGLLALLALSRWAGSRSRTIALQGFLLFALLLGTGTLWSLYWIPAPDWLGFATVMLAVGLAYGGLQTALTLFAREPQWSYAVYGVVVLATVAVAYWPIALGLTWTIQTAFGWLALATLWTTLSLHDPRQSPRSRLAWANSALANIVLALGLGSLALKSTFIDGFAIVLLLLLASVLLMWLSLGLRRQVWFYGALLCAAGAGLICKQHYFSGPESGLIELVTVAALWIFLWRLDQREQVYHAVLANGEDHLSAATVAIPTISAAAVIRRPLEQAIVLLWIIGLARFGLLLLGGTVSVAGWMALGLSVATGGLLVGYFHRFYWIALPVLVGLLGLVGKLQQLGGSWPWLAAMAVLYALLVWRLGVSLLTQPLVERWVRLFGFTVPGGAGGRRQVETSLHGFAVLVGAGAVVFSVALAQTGTWIMALLPALFLALLLFLLAGWHYRSEGHAWGALLTLTVVAWLVEAYWVESNRFGVGQPLVNVALSAGLALAWLSLGTEKAVLLTYWRAPLRWLSSLLYLLALLGTGLGGLSGSVRLPILLGLLCLALLPVTQPWPHASVWRGFGLALLASALAWTLVEWGNFTWLATVWLMVGWGYALWVDGNLVLPRWNTRQPGWAIAPEPWPLLGLASVLLGIVLGYVTGVLSLTVSLAALSPYLFLLLRNTAWPGMAWLAVGTVVASGLLAGISLSEGYALPHSQQVEVLITNCATILLGLNVLFLLIPLWRRYGPQLAHWLGWRSTALAEPLFGLPFTALWIVMGQLGWLELVGLAGLLWPEPPSWRLSGVALFLVATAGHAFYREQGWLQAQGLLLALLVLVGALFLKTGLALLWAPLVLAVGNGALLLVWRYGTSLPVWQTALAQWLMGLPVLILVLLLTLTNFTGGAAAMTLVTLAAALLAEGWWRQAVKLLRWGLLLALIASYVVWIVDGAGLSIRLLLSLAPWFAVQTVLWLLAIRGVQQWLTRWLNTAVASTDAERMGQLDAMEEALQTLSPWLLSLSLLWLGVHSYENLVERIGWSAASAKFGFGAEFWATCVALSLLSGLAAVRAWRSPEQPCSVYAAALLLGWLFIYIRLIVFGFTGFTVGDTVVLMAAAYTALLLCQWSHSRPFYHLALVLPLLALGTAPWQLALPWTGGTLLALAVLYLSLANRLRDPLPLYLGVLALNGIIYLWAPLWADHYGLWQFYIVPAAVSVLALLHLHRRELRPKLLSAIRLGALSALYAGAGLDVVLRPELWVFVLALVLALIGVICGIALRVRVFLYTGVAFLVLNVVGQLIRIYPDQGLSRALVLIGLGTSIILAMVIFNLKREQFMQQIRIIRADLAAWE